MKLKRWRESSRVVGWLVATVARASTGEEGVSRAGRTAAMAAAAAG